MTYPSFAYAETMTLVKRSVSGQDDYGNDIYDETPITVDQCVFQPAGSSEGLIFADQVSTSDTIFMPYGTDVSALDAIDFDGERYEVTGDVSSWESPFSGRTSPIRVAVTRVTGGSPG
jgi:hypothetical protein